MNNKIISALSVLDSAKDSPSKETAQYSLGGLLYSPAVNSNLADMIIKHKYPGLTSLALCLEDAIGDACIGLAEQQLYKTLAKITKHCEKNSEAKKELPMVFVRIRNPFHLQTICRQMGSLSDILTGFILPKFDSANAEIYCDAFDSISTQNNRFFIMPVLESEEIINIRSRTESLYEIYDILNSIEEKVLNIRVGGNDFCNLFGLRRNATQTVYDIAVIKDVLTSIINVFSRKYIVSGPVWEYYDNQTGNDWKDGLLKEIELDRLNGFIGKTAIHPSQIPVINESMKVSTIHYEDALKIMHWDNPMAGVAKSAKGHRMNESKVHRNWAFKTVTIAEIYGLKDEPQQ